MDPFSNGNNEENKKNPIFPFLPSNYAIVVNDQGRIKVNKVGFSYTSLFFGVFPAILRADWYNLACMLGIEMFFTMLVTFITGVDLYTASRSLSFLFQIVWGLIYNLMYFRHLQNIGYRAENSNSLKLLIKSHYFKISSK